MIEKKKKRKKRGEFFFLKAIKFTESAAFCRVGRVTGNNNKFLLGLTFNSAVQSGSLGSHQNKNTCSIMVAITSMIGLVVVNTLYLSCGEPLKSQIQVD